MSSSISSSQLPRRTLYADQVARYRAPHPEKMFEFEKRSKNIF
jgi:hypothetical protein